MSHLIRSSGHGRYLLRDERGQGLVEFALVLPLVLLLVLGIADFGRALNFKNDETHLANEAARLAAVNGCPSCTGVQKINDVILAQAESPNASLAICYPLGTHAIGDPVHVTVRDSYHWLQVKIATAGINWNPALSTTFTSNAEMRLETALADKYSVGTWDSTSKTCS